MIASALYQNNQDYLTAIISVVNALEKQEDLDKPGSLGYSKEVGEIVEKVCEHIKLQLKNIHNLLEPKDKDSDMKGDDSNPEEGYTNF